MAGAILGHSTAAATEVYAHLQHDPSKIAADRVSGTISAALDGKPHRSNCAVAACVSNSPIAR
jgi:hypothetical protein